MYKNFLEKKNKTSILIIKVDKNFNTDSKKNLIQIIWAKFLIINSNLQIIKK